MGRFWRESAGRRPPDSILRPTSLKYVHAMIIERLSTNETPQETSQWTKLMIAGTNFGRYFSLSGGSVMSNFGMDGQDAVVFLPSKALK